MLVKDSLTGVGLLVTPFGQEYLFSRELKTFLSGLGEDDHALMLRFQPDFFVSCPKSKQTLFIEVKSSMAGGSPNYPIEMSSFFAMQSWAKFGIPVIVVFGDWVSIHVNEIMFHKVFVPVNRYNEQERKILELLYQERLGNDIRIRYKETLSGSRTPFGLMFTSDCIPFDIMIESVFDLQMSEEDKNTHQQQLALF